MKRKRKNRNQNTKDFTQIIILITAIINLIHTIIKLLE